MFTIITAIIQASTEKFRPEALYVGTVAMDIVLIRAIADIIIAQQ